MSYPLPQQTGQPQQRSLAFALSAGLGVAVACAFVWGLIIYVINRDFSLLAVGLGVAVGTVIARLRPGDMGAAVGSAAISLFGAVLGAILAGVFIVVNHGLSLGVTLSHLGTIISVVFHGEGFLGYLFWAIAAFFGFRIPMQVARGRARAIPAPVVMRAPPAGGFAPGDTVPGNGTQGDVAPGSAQSIPPMYMPPEFGSPQPPAQ